MRAFRAFWAACKDAFDELRWIAVNNLVWAILSIPLLFFAFNAFVAGFWLFAVVLSMLAVIPLGPSTAALVAVSYKISDGRAVKWADYFSAMRQYAVSSWKVMGIWMAVLLFIVLDLFFYSGIANAFGFGMTIFWFYVLVLWFGTLIYVFPLLILQEQFNLRQLARNTFLLTMGRPIFTLITLILLITVVVISSFVPILPVFFTFGFLAQCSMRATMELVKEAEERRAELEEKNKPKEPAERIPPWRMKQ